MEVILGTETVEDVVMRRSKMWRLRGTETVEDVVMRRRSKTCKPVLNGFC